MKQKRSLFNMIFGKRPQSQIGESTQLKMLNSYIPTFTPFGEEAYSNDVVRAAIDAIARNAAKLKPKHIRRVNGKILPQTSSVIERLLQVRPNPHMDAYTFYYKVITQLYMKNNAYIYIDIDPMTGIKGFYPINPLNLELLEYQGEMFVRFRFLSGQHVVLPYTDIIHLRRFFYKHDIFGESNDTALNPTLELINTTNQGIINAIKSSAVLRGILKFTQTLRPEDIKKERDRFVLEYMSIDNNGGIGAIDAKAEFVPMDNKPQTVNKPQMEHIKNQVYDYFGVNENIIQSKYNEEQWNAFYESVLEPISIQLSLEFTSKLFTDRERGFGNEIIFESNRLQYASNKTKVEVVNLLIDRGMMSLNDGLEVFNLPPIEGGDKRIVSLNFVDASKANKYQLGEKEGDNGDSEGNQE